MADDVSLRRCTGSQRFGIEPHDAPMEDFPNQPSQKDGLGRMCRPHWGVYTAGLARDAKARKAVAPEGAAAESVPAGPIEREPARKRAKEEPIPVAGSQGDAG